jgi:precorrin-2 dehydrogenase/sirohydrochlorin ferrochelatase
MFFYPVNLNLKDRPCLIIGGGKVAARKAQGLLNCEAQVTIISPTLISELASMLQAGGLSWVKRNYRPGDLRDVFLVIAATDDESVQQQIYEEAEERGVLINVADVPARCNFILPATVRRGDLVISVSTGGKSPALAKQLRMELEKRFGPEYRILVNILGGLRPNVLSVGRSQAENEVLFRNIMHKDMIRWIERRDWDSLKRHLESVLGEGTTDDSLEREFFSKC